MTRETTDAKLLQVEDGRWDATWNTDSSSWCLCDRKEIPLNLKVLFFPITLLLSVPFSTFPSFPVCVCLKYMFMCIHSFIRILFKDAEHHLSMTVEDQLRKYAAIPWQSLLRKYFYTFVHLTKYIASAVFCWCRHTCFYMCECITECIYVHPTYDQCLWQAWRVDPLELKSHRWLWAPCGSGN